MDAKKQIMQFIKPNIIPAIVLIVIFPLALLGLLILLCAALPTYNRAKKSIARLEANGWLEKAAEQMLSSNAKHLVKGKVILTEDFVFCKNTGRIFTYDEILWAYRHRYTQTLLFIPIKVTDSLYLGTKTMKPQGVASMGKDKKEEIKAAIVEIYTHNPSCLIGYTKETVAGYKAAVKN